MYRNGNGLNGIGRHFQAAVERPNGLNQLLRPLLNGLMQCGLAAVTAGLIALWAVLFGAPVGPLLLLGVALVGIESVNLRWPPVVTWRARAKAHWRSYAALWGLGMLFALLWLAGAWPWSGRFLFWHWGRTGWPGPWYIVLLRGVHTPTFKPVGAWFYWLTVSYLVTVPLVWPLVLRNLWWRYATEIVAPTLADSIHAVPPRISGVPGIPFHYPAGGASDSPPVVVSAQPAGGGEL